MTTPMPLLLDPDDLLEYLLTHDWGFEELDDGLARIGRNNAPYVLHAVAEAVGLPRAWAARIVPGVWSGVEFPMEALTREEWRELFDCAGYTYNGRRRARPRKPLTLYRGATEQHRDGWSWTADRALAQWFAARFSHTRTPGRVWVAVVEPHRLLAQINDQRDGESEYVVDTDDLLITALDG